MYGNTSIWNDLKREFRYGNVITRLIFANVGFFLAINLALMVVWLVTTGDGDINRQVTYYLTLPADIQQLLYKPWTLVTHMFTHFGFFHILFNMLWLFFIGRILREYLGDRKILPLYIYGGLAGAALYIISYNLIPRLQASVEFTGAIGASAAVMAIILATATLLPNFSIRLLLIGAVKLKWIAAAAVILDLLMIQSSNTGGHIAHLGGALFGFLYIKSYQKGNDLSIGFNRLVDWLATIFKRPKRGPRMAYKRANYTARDAAANPRATPTRETKIARQDRKARQEKVDYILDKISQSGYDSLTKAEKDFLFEASKEN